MGIDERRRAEGDFVGEDDAAAMLFDRFALGGDLARHILRAVDVVAALDVDVRTNDLERRFGRRRMIDAGPVHIVDGRQHLRPQ